LFHFFIVRHKRANESKGGDCTDEEWEQILLSTLVERDNGPRWRDVEIKVDVQDKVAVLKFRKNIQGITVRPLPFQDVYAPY
jgi:hypothetical protein